jgi:hypothetical protein
MIDDFIDENLRGGGELKEIHSHFLEELKGMECASPNQWLKWAVESITRYSHHPWIACIACHLAADQQRSSLLVDSCDLMSLSLAFQSIKGDGMCQAEVLAAQRSLSSIYISLAQTRWRDNDISECTRLLKIAESHEDSLPVGQYRAELRTGIIRLASDVRESLLRRREKDKGVTNGCQPR